MYDRNGLELSPVSESFNAYKFTSVDFTTKRYDAYARGTRKHQNQWNMFTIGTYKDPRDAAYVAQKFDEEHDNQFVRDLVTDGEWYKYAREYRENIDIPEWEFPSEGLTIEDIELDYGYKTNRVSSPKEALIEAIKVFGKKPPVLKYVKPMVDAVEELYEDGLTYRQAAQKVVETML